ncbi:hypothetical protein ACFL2H_12400 [Planctomycetota bacterium]
MFSATFLSMLIFCFISATIGVRRRGGPIAWGSVAGILFPSVLVVIAFASGQFNAGDSPRHYFGSYSLLVDIGRSASFILGLRTVRRDLQTPHELGLVGFEVDGYRHFWSAADVANPVVERCTGCGGLVAMPCVACG